MPLTFKNIFFYFFIFIFFTFFLLSLLIFFPPQYFSLVLFNVDIIYVGLSCSSHSLLSKSRLFFFTCIMGLELTIIHSAWLSSWLISSFILNLVAGAHFVKPYINGTITALTAVLLRTLLSARASPSLTAYYASSFIFITYS